MIKAENKYSEDFPIIRQGISMNCRLVSTMKAFGDSNAEYLLAAILNKSGC